MLDYRDNDALVEKIHTDEDLLNWMKENIMFEDHPNTRVPEDVLDHMSGNDHSQAGFVYYFLKRLGYEDVKIWIAAESDNDHHVGTVHSITSYVKDGKIFYMDTNPMEEAGIFEIGPNDESTSVPNKIIDLHNEGKLGDPEKYFAIDVWETQDHYGWSVKEIINEEGPTVPSEVE